jgi:hypothetical protein
VLIAGLGWISTVLLLMTAALSVRKRMAYQGVGRLSAWVAAHTYLGIGAGFVILLHSGLRMGGLLTTLLLIVSSLTVASGLLGLGLSRKLPPLLTAMEEAPAIQEELLAAREENLRGLLELARDGSGEFRRLVEERLVSQTGSWSRMAQFYRRRSTIADELPGFERETEDAVARLQPEEQGAFKRAAEYALRVNKMNAELFLQRAMRGWLTLHIASTTLMMGLAAIHIFSELYY